MKILVISLLRLGDILLHQELARSLKRQYPSCQLHFLINSQFSSVAELVPEVDCWHHLNRKQLQRVLVERQQSPLVAFDVLGNLVAQMNSLKFDMIFNATHNHFSVRLMDLLQAQDKRGMTLESGRKVRDQNKWQTYLNENFSAIQGSRFHYLEVLHHALGVPLASPQAAGLNRRGPIYLQLLTSDLKKNWGLRRFHLLRRRLQMAFPQHSFLCLCSPAEADQVGEIFAWNEFIAPNLSEAGELLAEASMLVTGDTSLQHMAVAKACPVVSLFLGSADPFKTAPRQQGAWILQGAAKCAPCSHASPCSQASHLCAEALSVEMVFDFISGLLGTEAVALTSNGFYQVGELEGATFLHSREKGQLIRQIEHCVWNAYLHESKVDAREFVGEDLAALEGVLADHQSFIEHIEQIENLGRLGKDLQQNFLQIEEDFPVWRDSLIRYKQNFNIKDELQTLILIRAELLEELRQMKGGSHVRKSQSNVQEHFATT